MPQPLLPEFVWTHLTDKLRLSQREVDVIQRLCSDEPEAVIAHQLGISPHTVHSHMERLYRKLNVASRAQVVIRLFREYIAHVPPSDAAFRVGRASNGSRTPRRRLFRRVSRTQLAGVISVRFGDRACDDLLIDLGPGGLRMRATRTVPPSQMLEGATLIRQSRPTRPVRVPVARIESSPCVFEGTEFLTHRAVFSRVLPASLCSALQSALGDGPSVAAGISH